MQDLPDHLGVDKRPERLVGAGDLPDRVDPAVQKQAGPLALQVQPPDHVAQVGELDGQQVALAGFLLLGAPREDAVRRGQNASPAVDDLDPEQHEGQGVQPVEGLAPGPAGLGDGAAGEPAQVVPPIGLDEDLRLGGQRQARQVQRGVEGRHPVRRRVVEDAEPRARDLAAAREIEPADHGFRSRAVTILIFRSRLTSNPVTVN